MKPIEIDSGIDEQNILGDAHKRFEVAEEAFSRADCKSAIAANETINGGVGSVDRESIAETRNYHQAVAL